MGSAVAAHQGYGTASAAHIAASVSALRELAELVTAQDRQAGTRPLYVRLSHVDHGAFLTLLLYGFSITPATGRVVTRPMVPLLDESPRTAAAMLSPDACTQDQPLSQAVVANHPVGMQIDSVLAGLSTLTARQQLVSSSAAGAPDLDQRAAGADVDAVTAMKDMVRIKGWRAAAEAIGVRARAAGFPLVVTYDRVLLGRGAIADRAPILRRVYNEVRAARKAVDKTVALLSQGLFSVGGTSQAMAAFGRDLLDLTANRTYLAHLARDAFVCGNGYLSFGAVPDEDVQLLPPESVTILTETTVRLDHGDEHSIHDKVLHLTGAEQLSSPYGVSMLEPFVQPLLQRELMQHLIDTAQAWDRPEVPDQYRQDAAARVPMAHRALAAIENNFEQLSGAAAALRVDPPPDLYFPGHDRMAHAAEGLALVTDEPPNAGEARR